MINEKWLIIPIILILIAIGLYVGVLIDMYKFFKKRR